MILPQKLYKCQYITYIKMEGKINICNDCVKFEKFGKKCHVHWEDKKHCTMKAKNEEEWAEQARALGTR